MHNFFYSYNVLLHVLSNNANLQEVTLLYTCSQARIYARGPGPGRHIFRGDILKKLRLKYGMRKKKVVHEREI